MKRQPARWEKVLANHQSRKGCSESSPLPLCWGGQRAQREGRAHVGRSLQHTLRPTAILLDSHFLNFFCPYSYIILFFSSTHFKLLLLPVHIWSFLSALNLLCLQIQGRRQGRGEWLTGWPADRKIKPLLQVACKAARSPTPSYVSRREDVMPGSELFKPLAAQPVSKRNIKKKLTQNR